MSGWQPVTRSWTRGSTSCCDAPSSGRSTASLKDRPVSGEAYSAPFDGMPDPFRTQRKTASIRFKGTYRGRKGTSLQSLSMGCSVVRWQHHQVALKLIIWIIIPCQKDQSFLSRLMGMKFTPVYVYEVLSVEIQNGKKKNNNLVTSSWFGV